jgi:predicted helicase
VNIQRFCASLLFRTLFNGAVDFRTIEARIAALPEEWQRGCAFERFVEGFLRTMPVWQVADLWPCAQDIPLRIRRTLNLPNDGTSIDGAFRTLTGDHVAYQVKFRAGRPKTGRGELGTFLG